MQYQMEESGMSDEVLEHLKEGIRKFRAEVYPAQEQQYRRVMSEPQSPHALIITCADSRIQTHALTQADPGDVFVTRNIGNMVPAYGEMLGGVSAVLEFAVSAMGVEHIVVCGHSECGAMKALLEPESVEGMPTVKAWLRNAKEALAAARAIQQKRGGTEGDLLRLVTEQNVLLQMRHVASHPSVAEAMAEKKLTISGWVYDIAEGTVRICANGGERFEEV
jgi:carbonic anhydrase